MISMFLLISSESITYLHDRSVDRESTAYEAACGQHVFQFSFENHSYSPAPDFAREGKGRVQRVTVNGKPVEQAANTFKSKIAGRYISKVGIMNCGLDENNPVFDGILRMTEIESKLYKLAPNIYSKLRREKGTWRTIFH